jgi:NAD(P)-dependent dehydrogenase (short-subunit alcohol dehydrogenase family)
MDASRHRESVVVVTGAASGIGRATALRLADEGATVWGIDRDSLGLEETAANGRGLVATAVVDLTDTNQVQQLVGNVLAEHGRIDAIANVAGVMDGQLPAHEVDDLTWDTVMAVNVGATMRLTRAVLPAMMDVGAGAMVNIASEAGLRGGIGGAAYTASKHAVIGYTKSVAWMYGPRGIRANVVCPGAVDTAMIQRPGQSALGLERTGLISALKMSVAQPDQIAAVVSWVLSAEADNVSGAVIAADGGWSAG